MNLKKIKYWLAIKFPFLEKILLTKEEQKRLAIAILRCNMRFFGKDMSDVPDERIEEAAIQLHSAMPKTGITSAELTNSYKKFLHL